MLLPLNYGQDQIRRIVYDQYKRPRLQEPTNWGADSGREIQGGPTSTLDGGVFTRAGERVNSDTSDTEKSDTGTSDEDSEDEHSEDEHRRDDPVLTHGGRVPTQTALSNTTLSTTSTAIIRETYKEVTYKKAGSEIPELEIRDR